MSSTPVSTGYPDLDALLPRLEAVPTLECRRPRGGAHRCPRPEERPAHRRAQDAGRASGRGPEALRRGGEPGSRRGSRRRSTERRDRLADERRRRESVGLDLTMPGRGRWVGRRAPGDEGGRRDRRHLPRARLRRGDRPRGRDRVVQLPRAQLPGRPPGDGHARHALPRCAARGRRAGGEAPAPHAHVAGADPHACWPPRRPCAW